VKSRGTSFHQLYDWLSARDRSEPLVILRLGLAAEIAAIAERIKNDH
jgi:hypothetical protein